MDLTQPGGRSVRRLLGFAMLVPLLATGCGVTKTATAAVRSSGDVRATVMFVGDSNIERALTALGIVLTDRAEAYQLVDVARAGTGIRSFDCLGHAQCRTGDCWKARLAQALQHTSPDGFVVELGINDTVAPGTAVTPGYAAYGQKIDWLMRLLPSSKPVWWTNLPCAIEPADRATGCAAVNRALAAAPRRWPNLTVLDWARVADTHPRYLLATLKHIHFSEPGALTWSRLLAKALDGALPRVRPKGAARSICVARIRPQCVAFRASHRPETTSSSRRRCWAPTTS